MPAKHAAHLSGVSARTSYPALQMQSPLDTDAAGEPLVLAQDVHTVIPVLSAYVLAGQSVHAEEPATDLYLPSAQPAHSGPNAPV